MSRIGMAKAPLVIVIIVAGLVATGVSAGISAFSSGARGPKGDTGATGPQGPKGDTGPMGAAGAVMNFAITSGAFLNVTLDQKVNLGNVTLTAPGNGTVHVTFTSSITVRNDSLHMWLDSNATSVGFQGSGAYGGSQTVNGSTASEITYYTLAAQAIYNVTAGNSYYFKAQIQRMWNPGLRLGQDYDAQVDNGILTGVFYPT